MSVTESAERVALLTRYLQQYKKEGMTPELEKKVRALFLGKIILSWFGLKQN